MAEKSSTDDGLLTSSEDQLAEDGILTIGFVGKIYISITNY